MQYRYFIHLAYNGSNYAGWQVQPNAVTVQELLESGMKHLAKIDSVTGCGRTDTGVHASDFYAHFDSEKKMPEHDLEKLTDKLNRFLPEDIKIFSIKPVVPDAHARFSAISREYRYLIIREKDPFLFENAYFLHGDLNVEARNQCAALLVGKHDFECFSKVKTEVSNFMCNVREARFSENGHVIEFTISADRFLRNMARAVVGTLLDVGKGKMDAGGFAGVLESRNRCKAGYSVPAKGLTLTKVEYDAKIFVEEPMGFLK